MPKINKGPRLELNKFGIWEIRGTDNRRSFRISTRCEDSAAAQRFFAGWLLERDAFTKKQGMTVAECVKVYMVEHVRQGNVVAKDRQEYAAVPITQYFGHLLPVQIMPNDITNYSRQRKNGNVGTKKAMSAGTIRRELCLLNAAIRYCVKTRRLSPADVPYIPMPEASGPKDLWLTEQESDQLLAVARRRNDRGGLFIMVALATASRRTAIEELRWDQVDLAHKMIHFNPVGRAQSSKRRVPVPISDDLFAALSERRVNYPDDVFVLGKDTRIRSAIRSIRNEVFQETKNNKFLKVTPHVLRHTWATQAARAGVSLYQIAGVLGDTLETVQKNYLHHCPEHLRGAVNYQLSAQLGATRSTGLAGRPTMTDKTDQEIRTIQ